MQDSLTPKDQFMAVPPRLVDMSAPKIPPPPVQAPKTPVSLAEVNVRTMASDIKSIGEMGWTSQTRKNSGLPGEKVAVELRSVTGGKSISFGVLVLIGLASAGFVLLLWFYFLPALFSFKNDSELNNMPNSLPVATSTGIIPSPLSPSFFSHESFFKTPADEAIRFDLMSSLDSGDLSTYTRTLSAAIASVNDESNFIEVTLEQGENKPVSWTGLLEWVGAPLISTEFWRENFSPDFTFFVYRDENGLWPGYVLLMKSDKKQLLIQPQVLGIENSSAELVNLFLDNPGEQSGPFRDEQVLNQPVRIGGFKAPGANFTHGWFYGSYLILSTSLDGLRFAIQRL